MVDARKVLLVPSCVAASLVVSLASVLSTEKDGRLIVESPKSNHSHTQMTANLLPNPEPFLISPYNA